MHEGFVEKYCQSSLQNHYQVPGALLLCLLGATKAQSYYCFFPRLSNNFRERERKKKIHTHTPNITYFEIP